MAIKIKVDIERLRKITTPEQYYGLFGLAGSPPLREWEAYSLLLNFVEGENGEILTVENARARMKEITQDQLAKEVIPQFFKAMSESLVNPTKGNS